jgi:hypothetical protein
MTGYIETSPSEVNGPHAAHCTNTTVGRPSVGSGTTREGGSPKAWNPTAADLEAILEEMQPVIARFVERDRLRLAEWRRAT